MSGLSAEVTNLSFSVDVPQGRQVIADIPQLAIPAGELTVLAGPSGSGKSTLLYLLAGLLVPQNGSVSWGGIDLARQGEAARDRWRLANAGFIFQSFNLIEELSPLDNVLLPVWFGGTSAGHRRERAQALLDRFGVPGNRGRASVLSRGEQQRVAIARALLLDPKVIFADEPTASLDAATGAVVAEALETLARDEGRTVIVASHDPALLDRAHRVIRLDHGRIDTQPAAIAA